MDVPRAVLAAALGLAETDIGERPLWVKAGKEQLIVPLCSLDAVRRAAPQPDAFGAIRSEDGIGMAYVFAERGPGATLARFFFPSGTADARGPRDRFRNRQFRRLVARHGASRCPLGSRSRRANSWAALRRFISR